MVKITSKFGKDRDDWTFNGSTDDLTYVKNGGFIRGGEGGLTFDGGFEWSGDLSRNFGGQLSFRLRQDGTDPFGGVNAKFQIFGENGGSLTHFFNVTGTDTWNSYKIRLDQFSNWRTANGSIASEEQMREVLKSVSGVKVSGETRSDDSRTDLDKVILLNGKAEKGDDVARDRATDIRSTFEFGGEGWSFINDVQNFNHFTEGGVKDGFIQAVDRASGSIMYYVAPAEFTGKKAGFYEGKLSFSLKLVSGSGPSAGQDDVTIIGANGTTIVWNSGITPGRDWTEYSVRLAEFEGWTIDTKDGAVAEEDTIRGVLADISELRIRGEFINGGETTALDEVRLEAVDRAFDVFDRSGTFFGSFNRMDRALEEAETLSGPTIVVGEEVSGKFEVANSILILEDPLDNVNAEFTLIEPGRNTFTADGGDNVRVIGGDERDTIILENVGRATVIGGDEPESNNDKGDFIRVDARKAATIKGGGGNDTLLALGAGKNKLGGGSGNDELGTLSGRDKLTGGAGNDSFVFNGKNTWGNDTILDFVQGEDVIRFLRMEKTFGITEFSDLDGLWSSSPAGNLRLTIGDNTITFKGYTLENGLTAVDFEF